MSSKKIVITGGAGFVGTNLIKLLLKKTNYKLISIDDYSSSLRKNHIKDSSNYLPGHGGFFDRFDSFFSTIIFLYIFILF